MDYTIITKTQVRCIEKLQKIARPSENEPKILTTYPNGKQEVSCSIQGLNDFWNELINNYTKEWVMTFEQVLYGFKIGVPWYKKDEIHTGLCPFCRINPDMIDFCLSQRKIQIIDKWKNLVWSSFGGVIASGLFKLLS